LVKNDGLPSSWVHLTLGILCTFQVFFYALTYFYLDSEEVSTPAQVPQAVGWQAKSKL